MKLYGIGNVTNENLLKVLSPAEVEKYKGNLTELSSLYKYKKAKEYFGFSKEISLRKAYASLDKDIVDSLSDEQFIRLMEWKLGK